MWCWELTFPDHHKSIVGVSLLAMDVNDNAFIQGKRVALRTIVGAPPEQSSVDRMILQ